MFDRLAKRKDVKDFLDDKNKNCLNIKFENDDDGARHFIEWLKGFMGSSDITPIELQASWTNIVESPYGALYGKLLGVGKFDKYVSLYTKISSADEKIIEEALTDVSKTDIASAVAVATTSNPTPLIPTILKKAKKLAKLRLNAQEKKDLHESFLYGLKQRQDVGFIIYIESSFGSTVHKRIEDEIVPRDTKNYKNKFIFIYNHRAKIEADFSLDGIKKEHISGYLKTNSGRLSLSDNKVNNFLKFFNDDEVYKYAAVRKKAVDGLEFNNAQNCNKTLEY